MYLPRSIGISFFAVVFLMLLHAPLVFGRETSTVAPDPVDRPSVSRPLPQDPGETADVPTEECVRLRQAANDALQEYGRESEEFASAIAAYRELCVPRDSLAPAPALRPVVPGSLRRDFDSLSVENAVLDRCEHIDRRLRQEDLSPEVIERLQAMKEECEERTVRVHDCRLRHLALQEMNPRDEAYGQARAAFSRECVSSAAHSATVVRSVRPDSACVALRSTLVMTAGRAGRSSEAFATLKLKFDEQCGAGEVIPVLTVEDPALTEEDAAELASPFSDTQDLTAVHMFARGIFTGVGNTGEFQGGQPTNRAQVAKVLFRACGLPEDTEEGEVSLSDVPRNEWFAPFVRAAMRRDIIGGYPDGTFRPANIVTRAEFAKMFIRACSMDEDLPHGFSDVDDDDWFAPFLGAVERYDMIPAAAATGIFDGADPMTRRDLSIAIDAWLRNRVR